MSQQKRIEFSIQGMRCQSCEILIESKFRQLPGVKDARVKYPSGKAIVFCDCEQEPNLQEFQKAIRDDGYRIIQASKDEHISVSHKNSKRDYLEMGAIFTIIFGLYLFFKETKFFNFDFSISENMSYGLIFLVGLVAASSTCIAVAGGVLLSVAAKYNEFYQPETKFQKFIPHLFFNLGRIVSYTILGGVIGALGSALSFSPKTMGLVTLVAAIFMILMGFRILNIFPWLTRFSIRMPKFISHKILSFEGKKGKAIPFVSGALTFFLPCGFTQAFQLYAISRGSFVEGALIMLFFSLGTLPALLSLGALSSFTKGGIGRLFLKFSGVLVLILGFYNIGNALALTGNAVNFSSVFNGQLINSSASDVRVVDSKQVVSMAVTSRGYVPNRLTVQQGIPVQWEIDGVDPYGCTSVITIPKYGIVSYIQPGKNVIEFFPKEAGEVLFTCSMGMYRGSFTVLPNKETSKCDPAVMNCIQ